jgi:hypothetical protein
LGTPENNERCLSDDNIGQNKMSTAACNRRTLLSRTNFWNSG